MDCLPNFKTVELCLTYRCNVRCNNCSNLCTQAPFDKGDLSVIDVAHFLKDSIVSNHKWEVITLHGGEPVLNKDIIGICKLLYDYRKDFNKTVNIWILSNNSTPAINASIRALCEDYLFKPGFSTKIKSNVNENGDSIPYVAINESPEDLGLPYTQGCFQSSSCGICFNYLGFFECSPAAAAARVFGYEPLARHVSELIVEKCIEAYKSHCKHCGFSLPDRRRVVEQVSTKTWIEKFNEYNKSI